jgi:hypothetical protein
MRHDAAAATWKVYINTLAPSRGLGTQRLSARYTTCSVCYAIEAASAGLLTELDWFLWEPVHSAHILRDGAFVSMDEEDFDSVVIHGSGTIDLRATVGRWPVAVMDITVATPCTRKAVLDALHAAYSSPLSKEELATVEATLDDGLWDRFGMGYLENVKQAFHEGRQPAVMELNGPLNYNGDKDDLAAPELLGTRRRHPLTRCVGGMRLEGLVWHPEEGMYCTVMGPDWV